MNHLRKNAVARTFIGLRLIAGLLMERIRKCVVGCSDLFYHLTLFRRQPGDISFNVERATADGFIRHYVRNEEGRWQLETTTFYIGNRWIGENRGRPTSRLLWCIKTAAETALHVRVHTVVWGMESWQQIEARPFDMSLLPSEDEIRQRLSARLKVQAFMAKHFPARTVPSAQTLRDIILR